MKLSRKKAGYLSRLFVFLNDYANKKTFEKRH